MNRKLNRHRLYNQLLTPQQKFNTPKEIISWFCGIQAQDYQAAKFAIGVRLPGSTEEDIDKAIRKGEIIRTWPMRGTLHFVCSEDIHWLFDLLIPVNKSIFKSRYVQLGLDKKLLAKSNRILTKILENGNHLTREEISLAFQNKGIQTDGNRLYHILNNAALEKLICFGVMREKKFTFTLLDNLVKTKKNFSREEALSEMARRYFRSRGPASLKDFVWWSGLTITNARAALNSILPELIRTKDGDSILYSYEISDKFSVMSTVMLPAFDEYLIAYKNRSSMLDPLHTNKTIYNNGIFNPIIVLDGIVLGMWKRTFQKKIVIVKIDPFIKYSSKQKEAITREVRRYGHFLNKDISIEW